MKKQIKRIFSKLRQRSNLEILADAELINDGKKFFPPPNANTLIPSISQLNLEVLLDIRDILRNQ